ncbi:MAG: molybdopterin molybdotransferase MoeA [Campylobacter sp.]|nr:molybdopterin molybdotransferase MoeA [Campylobacter sp.]
MDIFETINLINSTITPTNKTEIITIDKALNKVLSKDIISSKSLPCFDNSAMDGYAFNYKDRDKPLKIIETIFAGDKLTRELNSGETYKIMTGAMIPKNADTIIEVEKAKFDGFGNLIIPNNIKQHNAYRYKGEEISSGRVLLKKGEKLTPPKLMLLAATGINEIKVYQMPKIALFSTGNEIIEPWQKADEFEIYNANATGVAQILLQNGYQSTYKGIIKDDLDEVISKLKSADEFDLIITSGGASVGDKDYLKEALILLGYKPLFENIEVRPGKPTKLYQKDGKFVMILPGNPMAAYLISYTIILAFLNRRLGCNSLHLMPMIAEFAMDIKLKPKRANMILGNYEFGKFTPINGGKFGSAMIMPIVKANALYISKLGTSEVKAGEIVPIFGLI